ncbi:MAG: class I SAM-dependent methyltransferase [Cyanobacteriota bacterium]
MDHALPEHGTLLHVGCGGKRIDRTPFAGSGWQELRLDIDPSVEPDLVGSLTDLGAVADASVDAVFSSHNLEHLYPHEVPTALAEFRRVLKPSGLVVITCPDLQTVAALVAEDRLVEPAYTSGMGPITPLDILYGHRASLAAGNHYMAHRCGFTRTVLTGTVRAAGFVQCASLRRPSAFDLWILATVETWSDERLREAAGRLLPSG